MFPLVLRSFITFVVILMGIRNFLTVNIFKVVILVVIILLVVANIIMIDLLVTMMITMVMRLLIFPSITIFVTVMHLMVKGFLMMMVLFVMRGFLTIM